LDIVIEVNKSALEVLLLAQAKMSQMTKDELISFRLDEALGGRSPSIIRRALKRLYGYFS
uniref:CopG family transcriptional regulator n=1 Tax=Gongylonema pulchrum TaxID=637853 RepID=A0A183DE80_9BILA